MVWVMEEVDEAVFFLIVLLFFMWSILTRFLEIQIISVAHMYMFSLKARWSVVESFHHAIVIPGIIFILC